MRVDVDEAEDRRPCGVRIPWRLPCEGSLRLLLHAAIGANERHQDLHTPNPIARLPMSQILPITLTAVGYFVIIFVATALLAALTRAIDLQQGRQREAWEPASGNLRPTVVRSPPVSMWCSTQFT